MFLLLLPSFHALYTHRFHCDIINRALDQYQHEHGAYPFALNLLTISGFGLVCVVEEQGKQCCYYCPELDDHLCLGHFQNLLLLVSCSLSLELPI